MSGEVRSVHSNTITISGSSTIDSMYSEFSLWSREGVHAQEHLINLLSFSQHLPLEGGELKFESPTAKFIPSDADCITVAHVLKNSNQVAVRAGANRSLLEFYLVYEWSEFAKRHTEFYAFSNWFSLLIARLIVLHMFLAFLIGWHLTSVEFWTAKFRRWHLQLTYSTKLLEFTALSRPKNSY